MERRIQNAVHGGDALVSTTPNQSLVAPAHDARNEPADTAAALRVAAEIEAVEDADVVAVNLDIAAMVGGVLAAMPAIEKQLPVIETLQGLRVERIRRLRDYAQATLHWQARSLFAVTPTTGLAEKVTEAIAMRESIQDDLKALSRHGVLDISSLADFGTSIAYRRVGTELLALSRFVHERWSAIQGRSMLTLEQMDAAQRLGNEIVRLCGERDGSPVVAADAVRNRDKAYTLTVRAYNEARAALLFIRREEGDVDTIAPSLWAGRGGSKRREDAPTVNKGAAPPADAPASAPVVHSSLLVPASELQG